MIVPSTIVCGTSGCMPNACSAQPVPFFLSCTAFTLEEPMSSPMHCLAMDPLRMEILSRPAEISKNRSGNAVLLHLVEQRAMTDLEQLGGVGAVAGSDTEGSANELLFERPRCLLDR